MKRKITIGSAVTLVSFLAVVVPLPSYAGSPLLSGYGGPGAGEQAIVGSTLLGGAGGGGGSGSASGSGSGAGGAQLATPKTSAGATAGVTGRTGGTPPSGRGSSKGTSHGSRADSNGLQAGRARAFVYPQTSTSAQQDTSSIGVSSTDIFALIAIVATLMLIGVLTMRFSRLQP